jgi:hypothetical protein
LKQADEIVISYVSRSMCQTSARHCAWRKPDSRFTPVIAFSRWV